MIAQAVPAVAVEIGLEFGAALLLLFAVRRQLVVEKGQQILLGGLAAGKGSQIARTDVAPAAKGGGKAQIGDDLLQQRQIFTEDLILQRHVGGADHQRLLLFASDGDAGNKIGERFADAGGRLNGQMPPLFPSQGFGDVSNHLPLRCARNKVGDLLL